ncbi:hypothetical protein [Microbacterium sp. MYb64]|uniref:hypothetical protein n=1 Tax=Microbacterium sp. MYb64 TaxID=1848691 RepID=UPI000CFC926A|nr:hypothetical protein [Microbacterium sp. MYb64]PRB07247.1 hypothetical protein CQ044_06810 [Microbacterium sp. MYb64]
MFHETSVGPRWMVYLGAAVLVFLAAITAIVVPAIVAKPDAPDPWIIWLLPVAFLVILVAGVLFLLRRITLTVSDTHITARLVPFRVMHIPLAEVRQVETTTVTIGDAGGLGWRLAGSARFLLWSPGPAVCVTLTDGRTRVLRTDHAPELTRVITTSALTSS